ncbi:putative LOC107387545-like protein, partial [Nothobranchius furzeri]
MVERFIEQFDAIQAAVLDQRLRKPMEKDKLEGFTCTDLTKAEMFIKCMQVLYTSTMCVSSEKSPTCSQIIPILMKLEAHFRQSDEDTVFTSSMKEKVWGSLQNRYQVSAEHAHFRQSDEDTVFTSSMKGKVWGSLQNRYQDENLQKFLKEATLMDPRFKGKLDEGEAADIWDRLEKAAVANATAAVEQPPIEDPQADRVMDDAEMKPEKYPRTVQKSALEKLFEDEDRQLKEDAASHTAGRVPSITEQV